MEPPPTPSMDRDASNVPSTPAPPGATVESTVAASNTIDFTKSMLSKGNAHSSWIGGMSILCGLLSVQKGICIDASQLPEKLVVILNCNTRSAWQFLLFSGCLPGLLGVLFNCVGSVDELHFEKQSDGSINMTRIRRHCSKVVKDRAIKVQAVGNLDDHHNDGSDSGNGSPRGMGSNSNSDSPTNSNNNNKQLENLVVIDGATGAKIKEVRLSEANAISGDDRTSFD